MKFQSDILLEPAEVILINDCHDFARQEYVQFRPMKFFSTNMITTKPDFKSARVKLKVMSTVKSTFIRQLVSGIIFILFVIHIATKNVLEKNGVTFVQNLSLDSFDDTTNIEEIFQSRKKILERSCSFITQLNTANQIATVNELKEIHLLLHDLKASSEEIAKKLQFYNQTKILLQKTQDSFMIQIRISVDSLLYK